MYGKFITAVAVAVQAAAFSVAAQESDTLRKPPPPEATQQAREQEKEDTRTTPESRDRSVPRGQSDERSASLDSSAFVQRAARSSMAEIELAQLALKKSRDEEIRELARHIIEDHRAANAKLESAAAQENVSMPSAVDPKTTQIINRLMLLQGEAFDREFRRQMQRDHKEAVALFESASQSPQVAEPLQEFASNTLPTLEKHRKLVQALGEDEPLPSTADPKTYRRTLPNDPKER